MEHQFQTSVLVNGEWVSRAVDPFEIMARDNQDPQSHSARPSTERQDDPDIGILSRVVIRSPSSKLILAAKVRHKDLNDVCMIGEDSVQVLQIGDFGRLQHVATKSDFQGNILAAKVFGMPREAHDSLPVGDPRSGLGFKRGQISPSAKEDHLLPPEVIVLTLSSRALMFLWAVKTEEGSVRFRHKSIRLPAGSPRFCQLGPHLAIEPMCRVIAVAAHEGCFMLYKTKRPAEWQHDHEEGIEQPPIVDERLISIEGRVMHMYFLPPGPNNDSSHVVLIIILVHNGKTKIACYDWDVRFGLDDASFRNVRSAIDLEDQDPSLLIPLTCGADFLLVFDEHITICTHVLSGPPHCKRIPIRRESFKSPSMHCGKGVRRWVQWSKVARNEDLSKDAFYIAREDGAILYIACGTTNTVEISEAGQWPYPIDTAFACLDADISDHEQSLSNVLIAGGVASNGYLCCASARPTGHTFYSNAAAIHTLTPISTIPSWTPLTDFCVIQSGSKMNSNHSQHQKDNRQGQELDRAMMLVTNGKAPHGAVSHLRKGLKATILDSFGGMSGCTGVFIMDHGTQAPVSGNGSLKEEYVTFLVCLPPESILIRATHKSLSLPVYHSSHLPTRSELGTWEKAQIPDEHGTVNDDIIRDSETVAAGCLSASFAIQIVKNEARTLRRPDMTGIDSILFPGNLLKASMMPESPYIAVCSRENDKIYLELLYILKNGSFLHQHRYRKEIPCDLTCLSLLMLDDVPHVLIGGVDASIFLGRIAAQGSSSDASPLKWIFTGTVSEALGHSIETVCESAAVIECGGPARLLLCGTRAGFLLYTVLIFSGDGHVPGFTSFIQMGDTAVHVVQNTLDSSAAFVSCGLDFCQARGDLRKSKMVDVQSVWFVDHRYSAYSQSSIIVSDQVPVIVQSPLVRKDLEGIMLLVSGEEMLFAQLEHGAYQTNTINNSRQRMGMIVPRQFETIGTPSRLSYLRHEIGNMVVATYQFEEAHSSLDSYRVMRTSIKIMSADSDQQEPDNDIKQESDENEDADQHVTAEIRLGNNERVYTMVEWTYIDHRNRKYHFVVVGTGITDRGGERSGRRLFLQLSKSGITLKKESSYNKGTVQGPVRCIAVYDNSHIVTVVGKYLQMEQYDATEGRWIRRQLVKLPSNGIHLTVVNGYVHVSTSHDSHICYKVSSSHSGGRSMQFDLLTTDSRQRALTYHLVCDRKGDHMMEHYQQVINPGSPKALVLVSDKTCALTAFFRPNTQSNKIAAEPVVEVSLPRSVIRLQRGDIRPPWRRPFRLATDPVEYQYPGILINDILGACSDGTIYHFSILDPNARHLLRLIQNLIEAKQRRNPELQHSIVRHDRDSGARWLPGYVSSSSPNEKLKAWDVDPGMNGKGNTAPRLRHIDGDIILRFFDEGGDLEELVKEGCEESVRNLFEEEVGRSRLADVPTFNVMNANNVYLMTKVWLDHILMPLL